MGKGMDGTPSRSKPAPAAAPQTPQSQKSRPMSFIAATPPSREAPIPRNARPKAEAPSRPYSVAGPVTPTHRVSAPRPPPPPPSTFFSPGTSALARFSTLKREETKKGAVRGCICHLNDKDKNGACNGCDKRIGPYVVIKKIGEGAFSKVQLAYHVITQKKFALKLVNKQSVANLKDITDQITNEVTLLKGIKGPAKSLFVTVEESFETENLFCLVMEYCEGGDLFTRVTASASLKENEAREYFAQIVSAVKALHDLGIVHRDLKLENFLLDGHNRIKLADFGLSKAFVEDGIDMGLMSTYCGTTDYAAPEILRNQEYDGRLTDIWSLGVVLFAMLSGVFPFKNVNNQMSASFTYPAAMPTLARSLISKILVVNPTSRISLQEILEHPWCATAAFLKDPHHPSTKSSHQKSFSQYSLSSFLSDPASLINQKSNSVPDALAAPKSDGSLQNPQKQLASSSEDIRPRAGSTPYRRVVASNSASAAFSSSPSSTGQVPPPPPPPPPALSKFKAFVHNQQAATQKFFASSKGKADDS